MAEPAPLPPEVQAALDRAACGLLRTDAAGVILAVNHTFCGWIGRPRAELLGRKLPDLLTIGGRIFHQTHLHPLLQMQGSVSEVKLEVRRPDGEVLPMVFNIQRQEQDGRTWFEVAAFVARDRDLYERELVRSRKRLEELVEEAKAHQAAARDRALIAEQMVGIVSHDLRNPLQTIQMGALLLQRGQPTARQLDVLGRISRATDRAHRLIADLLDFTQARLGSGLSVSMREVDLHALIAEAVDELSQAFPGRHLVHRREGAGPCTADPDRLSQLVGNLVGNAMAYGDAAAPVTVATAIAAGRFTIAVHNAGTPIPVDAQARLFHPMVRGTEGGGATRSVGLGLFIVGEIARAHGGRVEVASGAGEGTTFTATFPRAPR
ncbi:MAG TPA: PAS domain-containing sensor histidine kinase [Ramlibacter sp.]|nr:PAS domain-containing sensor histidine kinase [Ramlibacter sp.]